MFERQHLGNGFEKGLKTFKPLRMYSEEFTKCVVPFEDIKVGDYLFASVQMASPKEVYLKAGSNDAIIHINAFDIYDEVKNFKSAQSNVGLKVYAKVIDKLGGILVLSRKEVMQKTIDHLRQHLGETVEATIHSFACSGTNYNPYGAFLDIGNGLISLLHITNFSQIRISNLRNLFRIGDVVLVKIENYDEITSFFSISRKTAYPKLCFCEQDTIIVSCHGTVTNEYGVIDGIYVEYNPGNIGIVDIPPQLTEGSFLEGTKIRICIKKQKDVGFKGTFMGFVE